MSVIGSLIFCTDCGSLLDPLTSDQAVLKCDLCGKEYDPKKFENLRVVTESAPTAFPSALRAKRSIVRTSLQDSQLEEGAVIKEKCPRCGHDEMQFHTLQLRSADEGATVFYTCLKCNYRFRQAN